MPGARRNALDTSALCKKKNAPNEANVVSHGANCEIHHDDHSLGVNYVNEVPPIVDVPPVGIQ